MTLVTRLNGVKKPLHIMKSWELIHRVKRWFSDNLDLRKAVELYRHFSSRVQLSFGIGTRLTCDIPGKTSEYCH